MHRRVEAVRRRWLVVPVVALLFGCAPRDYPTAPAPHTAPQEELVRVSLASVPPGVAHGDQDCTSRYYRYQPEPRAATAELHVVGVYGGPEVHGDGGGGPRPTVHVHVARPGREIALVLTAYDPVDWTVTLEPGTRLRQVVLAGYHAQRASRPVDAPLDIYSYEDNRQLPGSSGYDYGYEWPSWKAQELVNVAQRLTGLPLASFRGCNHASRFAIGDEAPTREPQLAHGMPASCAPILREARRCMALVQSSKLRVVGVGLDSGTVCMGPTVTDAYLPGNASLGWIGDRLYACIHDRGVAEISIADGGTRIAPLDCEAVTSAGSLLLVTPSLQRSSTSGVERYASFDDLRAGHVDEHLATPWASRFAALGKIGYFASHATNEVVTRPLVPAAAGVPTTATTIKLEGYDGWLFGLDALADGTLVIASPTRTGRDIRMFDAKTGAQRGSMALGLHADIAGLKCSSL
jgi:hypothetical protein